MTNLRRWIGRELQHCRLGWQVGAIAVDRRSRARLLLLGAVVLVKQRTPFRDRGVRVRIAIRGRPYAVRLVGRTDLEVLREIAIHDEYGASDGVPAEVIVDLGAHSGLATLRLLAVRPGARVLAVEADPGLLPVLRENVAGLDVTVVHAAIGGTSAERSFFRAGDSTWGNSLDRTLPWQEQVTVPGLTLDALLDHHGIASVDLLKIDVEGAEWEVFADGLPARVRAIAGEFHARDGLPPRRLLERLGGELDVTVQRDDAERLVFVATRRSG
jgi:FkbM family methyltransferase